VKIQAAHLVVKECFEDVLILLVGKVEVEDLFRGGNFEGFGTDKEERSAQFQQRHSSASSLSQHRSGKPHNNLIILVCHWSQSR